MRLCRSAETNELWSSKQHHDDFLIWDFQMNDNITISTNQVTENISYGRGKR